MVLQFTVRSKTSRKPHFVEIVHADVVLRLKTFDRTFQKAASITALRSNAVFFKNPLKLLNKIDATGVFLHPLCLRRINDFSPCMQLVGQNATFGTAGQGRQSSGF